jgi:hypothetical protein
MKLRRRGFVVSLAAAITASACATTRAGSPAPAAATSTAAPTPGTPLAASGGPTPAQPTARPAAPAPTRAATPRPALPAPTATPVQPTPTAEPPPRVELDIRLWNGSAELQLDGRTIQAGKVNVSQLEHHQVAALVDGEVAAIADAPAEGGVVDLTVPPPLAGLAIMIENQADARPQTGLTQADVVYEALAEGGITRFVAVYLSGDADVVGPVRSLRHYFAFMAGDYGADIVHIGASPEGFAWRDAMNMGFLDESAGDPGVWRIRTRPPPHNAYTATAADRGFLADRGRQQNHQWGPLRFSPLAPVGAEPAESVSLRFAAWSYRVGYTWDADSQRYLRFMEGSPHRDAASGEQIAPATVVVQYANVTAIPGDEKLRLDVDLVGGSGDLVVFSGGTRREGSWSKGAPRDSTRWLDDAGQPLVIPPGPVWVELVPLGSEVAGENRSRG